MSRLGIDYETGLVYEGRSDPRHPVWPTPPICNATLIEQPSDFNNLPKSFSSNPFSWIFLETSFDFGTRVRRGRLYKNYGNADRETMRVEAHPAIHSDLIKAANNNWLVSKHLTLYIECDALLGRRNSGNGMRIVLGQSDAFSIWKIVQVERSLSSDVLLTLRAESSLGILPELDPTRINPISYPNVKSAYDRALDAAYRELPTSVVDQCRNAAVIFVSRWIQDRERAEVPSEKDLGAWIKIIQLTFGDKGRVALCSALEIIARLHSRGKDNERHKMQLRTVEDDDAILAVQALGFVLREIGWVKSD